MFDHRRWQRKDPVGAAARRGLETQRLCARTPQVRKKQRTLWLTQKRSFFKHRHFKVLRVYVWTPFGPFSIPSYIVACESGGSYTARNPSSDAGGRYQILDSTWHLYGGPDYPGSYDAAQAPGWLQDKIAHAIWIGGGASQWSCA